MKIGLLSDTHGYWGEEIVDYFGECDEIWHAGDVGTADILDHLTAVAPLRAVYGNIDGSDIRARLPLDLDFTLEGVRVFMTHIGGYPGRYTARVREQLRRLRPNLYICGHSHILKIVPDRQLDLLHINPGACGQHGFHQVRTLVRFELAAGQLSQVEVIELGRRGQL